MTGIQDRARRQLQQRRNTLRTRCGPPQLDGPPQQGEPQEQAELREVEAALLRIEQGTFGWCEVCGGAIGRNRLSALPQARYCIRCSSERPLEAPRG